MTKQEQDDKLARKHWKLTKAEHEEIDILTGKEVCKALLKAAREKKANK